MRGYIRLKKFNIVLQENIVDRWRWFIDTINGYFVSGTHDGGAFT